MGGMVVLAIPVTMASSLFTISEGGSRSPIEPLIIEKLSSVVTD